MSGERPLGFNEALWPDTKRGPWAVRAWWAEIDGRAECVGFGVWKGCHLDDAPSVRDPADLVVPPESGASVEALPQARPQRIGAADLRNIPFASVVNDLRRALGTAERTRRHEADIMRRKIRGRQDSDTDGALVASFFDAVLEDGPYFQKEGGRYPDEYWQQVADVYATAWKSGARNPTQTVAEHFKIPRSTAAKHVARAREEGHLTRLGQGRSGGVAPDKRRTATKKGTKR